MEKWKLVGLPGLSPFRNFNISGSSFSVSAQKSQGKFDETRKILIQVNKMKRKREQSLVTGKNYMQLHNKVWKITEFSSHCFLWRKFRETNFSTKNLISRNIFQMVLNTFFWQCSSSSNTHCAKATIFYLELLHWGPSKMHSSISSSSYSSRVDFPYNYKIYSQKNG